MDRLPPYADTPIGRELLAAIIANPPELGPDSTKQSGLYGGHREPCEADYRGKPAARLRRIYGEWLDRQYAEADRVYRATGVWNGKALEVERPNDLIARVLREAAMGAAA